MLTVDAYQLLSAEECERIITAGLSSPALRPGYMKNAEGADYVAPDVRQSKIAFLNPETFGEALAAKLIGEVLRLNNALFNVEDRKSVV